MDDEEGQVNLYETQRTILKQILSLNQVTSEDEEETDMTVGDNQVADRALFTFKVLLFDDVGQSVIAPVMKVGGLREHNVTLHMNLASKRQPVPDAACVYLIEPKEDAFRKVAEDGLMYDYLFINFTKPLSQEQLSQFSIEMVKANCIQRVCQVHQHYLNYQVIAPTFFTIPNCRQNFKRF